MCPDDPSQGSLTLVTIRDVAREARVSVATVSRALNGSAAVTARTRERVQRAAARLRYVPLGAARSLVTRRTQAIGALLPDLFGEFFSELIRGIDVAARARGLHLLVSSSHGDADEAAAALLMNSAAGGRRFARLNIDNHGGAFAMTRHLLACGHRDLAFITGPECNYDASERHRGFREAVAAARGATSRVLQGDFNEESGYRAGRALLAAKKRPDAVFAANDMMAIGCLSAFNEARVRVPGDIALAGFDDIPIARFMHPPLTTVWVRIADLGQAALERLVAQMDAPDAPPAGVTTLPCEVVVRASCGSSGRHTADRDRAQP